LKEQDIQQLHSLLVITVPYKAGSNHTYIMAVWCSASEQLQHHQLQSRCII